MKSFGAYKKDVRVKVAVALVIFGVAYSCSSFSVDIFEDKKKWKLPLHKISPGWTKEESLIPIALSGLASHHPKKFTLPSLIQVGNQGSQLSGSAWAVGYLALSYHYQNKKSELGYHCSPSFIYNQLVNGKDIGIALVRVLNFIEESGCSDLKYMPYEEKNLLQRPNMQSLEDASRHMIKGFARVDFTDINQVKAHLLQKSVVIATIVISENFVTLDDLEWRYPSGKKVGIQTVGVIGYDDDKRIFMIQNSAGRHWGENGMATLPYLWFLRLTQKAYVIW